MLLKKIIGRFHVTSHAPLILPQIVVENPNGNVRTIFDPDKDYTNASESECQSLLESRKSLTKPLRRNSISLPAGLDELDLDLLDAAHKTQAGVNIPIPEHETSVSSSLSGENDTEDDLSSNTRDTVKIPMRARKKSVTPIHMRKRPVTDEPISAEEYFETTESNSPANSITSVNSLASLLKEKIQVIPASIKKKQKKTPDLNVRAFVIFLFLAIVCTVSIAYILYHQKILQKAYFNRIKFNRYERTIRIFNTDGFQIIRGHLGKTLTKNTVYDCLPKHERNDGSICLEWMGAARFYLTYYELNEAVQRFDIEWKALSDGVHPTDCFDWSATSGHWYGGGQTRNMTWPLEKSSSDFHPFITGDAKTHQWGNVLKRYFIGSKGVAFKIDFISPLHISINGPSTKKQFCMKAQYDSFAYVNRPTEFPELKYSIYTSFNMKTLHYALSEKTLWDGLKKDDITTINSLISEPVWQMAPSLQSDLTETMIYNYTEDIIAYAFLKQGHVLVNEFWQEHLGDFTLDRERFTTLSNTVDIIHRRGFRIALKIQPFISTESANFQQCVRKRLLIAERHSDKRIPALTRYKTIESAGVLDFTKNDTTPWVKHQLNELMERYQIDSFYLDVGTAYNIPHYYQCENYLFNPDEFKTVLTNRLQGSINIIGLSSAVHRPRAPIFVSLPPFESSWEAIKKVIPTILTYGIIGYPFVMPGAIGGDVAAENNETRFYSDVLVDKELYIRWLQLGTFLPVIRYNDLPSMYGDDVLELAKKLSNLRQQLVTPLMKKYAREALDSGLPIVRPLWMIDPYDPSCHLVTDEFLVGEELIVAPILTQKKRQREVYLPAGVWKDGIDGSLRKGNRWIHNYQVLEHQVAYFQKMPDNTRFR